MNSISQFFVFFTYYFIIIALFNRFNNIKGFSVSPRGAGYLFGEDIVYSFCELNKVDFIARAHQLVMEGYKIIFNNKLATIWSAPNYCYRCGNSAAILELNDNLEKNVMKFEAAPVENRSIPAKKPVPDYFL